MSTITSASSSRRAVVHPAPRDADRVHPGPPSRRSCRTASRRRRRHPRHRRPGDPARAGACPASGFPRGASSPPTTTSKRWPISVAAKASSTVLRRLAETSPSRRPSSLRRSKTSSMPKQSCEALVERLVVGAIDADELLDVLLASEHVHLRLEARPADRRHQHLVGDLPAEHRPGGMAHRREDDPAGVDDGAVEVEEDDGEAHSFDASRVCARSRSAGRAALRAPPRARCRSRRRRRAARTAPAARARSGSRASRAP